MLEFPDHVVQMLVDAELAPTVRDRVAVLDDAELQRRYEEDPSSLGVLCVRHVLVENGRCSG